MADNKLTITDFYKSKKFLDIDTTPIEQYTVICSYDKGKIIRLTPTYNHCLWDNKTIIIENIQNKNVLSYKDMHNQDLLNGEHAINNLNARFIYLANITYPSIINMINSCKNDPTFDTKELRDQMVTMLNNSFKLDINNPDSKYSNSEAEIIYFPHIVNAIKNNNPLDYILDLIKETINANHVMDSLIVSSGFGEEKNIQLSIYAYVDNDCNTIKNLWCILPFHVLINPFGNYVKNAQYFEMADIIKDLTEKEFMFDLNLLLLDKQVYNLNFNEEKILRTSDANSRNQINLLSTNACIGYKNIDDNYLIDLVNIDFTNMSSYFYLLHYYGNYSFDTVKHNYLTNLNNWLGSLAGQRVMFSIQFHNLKDRILLSKKLDPNYDHNEVLENSLKNVPFIGELSTNDSKGILHENVERYDLLSMVNDTE